MSTRFPKPIKLVKILCGFGSVNRGLIISTPSSPLDYKEYYKLFSETCSNIKSKNKFLIKNILVKLIMVCTCYRNPRLYIARELNNKTKAKISSIDTCTSKLTGNKCCQGIPVNNIYKRIIVDY